MEYKIRKPKATDLFVVSKILKRIGLKNIINCFQSDEIKELAKIQTSEGVEIEKLELTTQAGISVMTNLGELILDKLDLVQDDLIVFISNLTGLKVKEVENLPITDFIEIVMDILKEPDFVDFIKVVLKSFN